MRNDIKRYLLFAMLGLLMMSCSSSSTEDTFSISGKLEGIEASYFMCAIELYEDSLILDTVRINMKGEFNYRRNIDRLTKVSLYFTNNQLSPLFVDKDMNIKIEGNVSDMYSLKIEGGEINEEIADFRRRNKGLIESSDVVLIDSILGRIDSNKDNFSGVVLLDLYLKDKLPSSKLDSLIHTFSDKVKDISYTKSILLETSEIGRASIGSLAPNFALSDIKNKKVKLADYAGKDVLLTFVEDEDSLLLDIYSKIEKKYPSISLLSFMVGTNKSEIKELKKNYMFDGKGWTSDILLNYNIKSLPYYVLISSSREIKSRGDLTEYVIETIQNLEDKD